MQPVFWVTREFTTARLTMAFFRVVSVTTISTTCHTHFPKDNMEIQFIHSANLVEVVYGDRFDQPFDESEDWFELTKVTREAISWDMAGVQTLSAEPELVTMTQRGSRRYSSSAQIELVTPEQLSVATLADVLSRRRSCENFSDQPVDFRTLSEICSLSYGVTARFGEQQFRTAPSAGALFPIDVFIHALNVEGLDRGVYYYSPGDNALSPLPALADDQQLIRALMMEDKVAPAFVVTLVATFWRTRFKYGHRGMRFALIEAGHIAQNVVLAATAKNLGSRPIGGFIDDELNGVIPGINGTDDAAVYSILVGHEGE